MPARTRQALSSATEVVEPDEERDVLRRLRFNEPLSWRVGKSAIPVADLLQRLQTLALELRKMEQEETDKESLKKVSQELASVQLLAHKDKGVKAWTVCCIVDILRLSAPDAPFTANQLKDIFTCIITSIIPAISDPSNAYNTQHIYVLNSLAEVKSIVLLTDLDSPDALILPLFTSCFDIVSGSSKTSTGEEVAKNVEFDMTRLLVTVIDEALSLAPEVIDVIVAQFLRVDPRITEQPGKKSKKTEITLDSRQDTLLLKDYPPAYNMAKAICYSCPEKMTNHISQYFNNVIIDASATSGTLNGSSRQAPYRRASTADSDEDEDDIKELSKAHRLIRELWRACPDVLQNVIPQLEAELSAESVSLRLLATQTIGDLTAGIGVAGLPPTPPTDPGSYPPVTLISYPQIMPPQNVLQMPLSPKPFSQAHSSAYESFLSRRQDKSPSVRAAWATAIGCILLTSAGGSGLSESEEHGLVTSLANMLRDADEKVRLSTVDVVGSFGFADIINKLSVGGGISTPDSVLSILAERVKDRRPQVRDHAMKILSQMWGVAAGEIEENNEQVVAFLADAPSKIFDAYYTNDPDIHVLLDRVLFERLLPLNYPPIKSKHPKISNQSQQQRKGQHFEKEPDTDVDKLRVQRILALLKGLDDKAKKVFFALQARQITMRQAMTIYLQACEDYNGGVIGKDEDRIRTQLTRVVDTLAKMMPDPSRVSADLWKFAKTHDRRNYQLIRFAMAAGSDYRTVIKAIKELAKRIQSGNAPSLLDTLTPFLYRSSSLVFNRSHIPAVIELSRTDEKGLANAAHEMLKEVSTRNPEVLEAQVQEMCKDLEAQAPSPKSVGDASTEEILKACSGFARRLPSKLPKERRFLLALANYALYSCSPRAAKHAVSILMTVADKKEMYAKDLIHKCVKDWNYGSNHFLTRLATISQLSLLAPKEVDEESDAIMSITVNQTLQNNRSHQPSSEYTWSEDDVDEGILAKEWALKAIVNRLRAKGGSDNEDDFRVHAEHVYGLLQKLVSQEGEISERKDTPASQRPRLRLFAAKLFVKLCASQSVCEHLLVPIDFNSLAYVSQDRHLPVRASFINLVKKKLVQNSHLGIRWYTIPCLLASEPSSSLRESTLTWIRSRAAFFSRQAQAGGKNNDLHMAMESVFSRLLSLLAYHPDYPASEIDEANKVEELADFARYILFYLSAVANENNLSLIFHIAQRVKQSRDGVTKSDEITQRLHTLSDLAQATIRRFADLYSQQHKVGGTGGVKILQTYPGKMRLPSSHFAPLSSHEEAQTIAEKNFLPEDIDDVLDRIVRSWMKPKSTSHVPNQGKKRKSEPTADTNGDLHSNKKIKKEKEKRLVIRRSSLAGNAKSHKRKKNKEDEDGWEFGGGANENISSARRRSGRRVGKDVSYVDGDSGQDDLEMDQWDRQNEAENEGSESDSGEEAQQEEDQDPDEEAKSRDEMEGVEERPPLPVKRAPTTRKRLAPPEEKAKELSDHKSDVEEGEEKKTKAEPTRRSTRRR